LGPESAVEAFEPIAPHEAEPEGTDAGSLAAQTFERRQCFGIDRVKAGFAVRTRVRDELTSRGAGSDRPSKARDDAAFALLDSKRARAQTHREPFAVVIPRKRGLGEPSRKRGKLRRAERFTGELAIHPGVERSIRPRPFVTQIGKECVDPADHLFAAGGVD